MKNTFTYYISFPYEKYVSYLKSVGEYDVGEDPIADRFFAIEDIEAIWGLEFLYPDGRTHKWYEDNKWWMHDDIHADFLKVDGTLDLNKPPLFNGKPLKTDKVYTLECVEDEDAPHVRFAHRIVKSRIKGLGGWRFQDID